MAVQLEEYERWKVLSSQVGVPVERLIVMGASMALPELERRIAALVSPIAAPQLVADVGANASGGDQAGAARAIAEVKPGPVYSRGPGGGKKRKPH